MKIFRLSQTFYHLLSVYYPQGFGTMGSVAFVLGLAPRAADLFGLVYSVIPLNPIW